MKPAILGGRPTFAEPCPYARPTLPPFERVLPELRRVFHSGIVTDGRLVRELETKVAARVGAADAVAVASCTTGLLMTLRALGRRGEVILPSFTFFATAHAVVWTGLEPVLVDCCPVTLTMDPAHVADAISARTVAILGVHVFGNPCDAGSLDSVAARGRIPVLYDAAHGLGGHYHGNPIGSLGLAEVFSLGPSKLVCGGEGGVIATRSREFARELRTVRNYGNRGDYDPTQIGLNGRMSEFHAALAIESLDELPRNVEKRHALQEVYREVLSRESGIRFQTVRAGNRSAIKDCALLVDEAACGLSAEELAQGLRAENVDCRRYFDPPVHRQKLYRRVRSSPAEGLPVTERVASEVLCPPFYSHMRLEDARRIAEAILNLCRHAAAVRQELQAAWLPKELAVPGDNL